VKRRQPITWPDNARIALVPCVAFETWPDDLGVPGSLQNMNRRPIPSTARFAKDLAVITDRQYGERVGIFRILDCFAEEGIHTTFFVSGATVEAYPDLFREIKAAGHEIGTENYIHDYSFMKSPQQERADQERTVAAVKKVLGDPPLGYLSTGVRPSEDSPRIISELGYSYWMDPQHEELPYTLRVGGKELTVLSYCLNLNDYTTYKAEERTPRELLQLWKDTFDVLYAEGSRSPNFIAWGLHPFLTGRPYRIVALREFLRYAKGHPNVWFARCLDVARWWEKNYRDHSVESWPNYGTGLQRG